MQNSKANSQPPEQQAERNETLDSPGSQVADYGNPTGGAANGDNANQQRDTVARPDEADDGRHTMGNP